MDGARAQGTARIALLVMPVVEVDRPSIGASQLRSVVQRELGDRVAVEILYLGHDFARYMAAGRAPVGLDLHRLLLENQHTGLPEWFFRQAAFPRQPDNTDAKRLERQRGEADLATWGEEQGFDAAAALRFLDGRALVWREGDRAMSLVLEEEPER